MSTLPGILTAIAGVLSAAGTAAGIYLSSQGGAPTPSPAPPTESVNITVQGSTVPSDTGQVNSSALSTDAQDSSADSQLQSEIDGCLNGDDNDCTTLLDDLATDCYDGSGLECDILYEVSEDGSDYQAYGATCGGRYDWTYADTCSEL